MTQARICSYYNARCMRTHVLATPATFLSLPEGLRDRVYRDAGVITGASVRILERDLPQDLKERIHNPLPPDNAAAFYISGSGGIPFFGITTEVEPLEAISAAYFNLSISNRAVRADVARYLCSYNEILLCCQDHTELSVLCNAPLYLVRSLRCLTIHLDVASYHGPRCRHLCNCCHRDTWDRHHETHRLKSTSQRFKVFIAAWHKVVSRLALFADVSKLRLNLYCDVGDLAAAQLIVQPLERMGLATCTMRLGGTRNAILKSIACRAVVSATRVKFQPFRFLHLPLELRQYILTFTDLVTPRRQIYVAGRIFKCARRWKDLSRCTTREFCSLDDLEFPSSNCFNSAVYPSCNCWRPPTPIFLVCKDVLRDARAIFFASNHFIVPPNDRTVTRNRQFEASFFLRHVIPSEALSSLRSLELTFPARFYDFSGTDDFSGFDKTIYTNWERTVDYITSRLKRLNLRLYMGFGELSESNSVYSGHVQRSQEALFQVHEHIVRPLQKLRCLDIFLVRAASPFNLESFLAKQQLPEHETHLESLVMGGEYNSMARAKFEQPGSEWWNNPGPYP